MTTYTIFSNASDDGDVSCSNGTYSTARSGGGSLAQDVSGTNEINVGQTFAGFVFYSCYEGFLSFDTSPIDDAETVSSAVLSLYLNTDNSGNDFTVNARLYDFGVSVNTSDYIAGASLSANTLLATLSSSGISTGAYVAFTSDGAFAANVSKVANTRMVLCSDRMEAGTSPGAGTAEFLVFRSADNTGTSTDPKLVIIAAASSAFPFSPNPMSHMLVR